MSDALADFLSEHRRALGPPRTSARFERFVASERSMRLSDFDPGRGVWPLTPASRKFRSALAAHAAESVASKELVILFDFRRWRRPKGELGLAPRQVLPATYHPEDGVLRGAGAPRSNSALPVDAVLLDDNDAAPDFAVDAATAYAVLVTARCDPLSSALDLDAHPCVRAARPLRRLAGASAEPPATEDRSDERDCSFAWAVPLDEEQAAAARAVLRGADAVLIGPPGAGKTQLITALVTAAPASWRIACTSPEASALDAVKRRLAQLALSATVFVGSPNEVAAATPPERPFDVIIVDEAGRLGVSTGIALAALARQMVAIGDPAQLGPAEGGPSLLDRALACGFTVFNLPWHYRSAEGRLIAPANFLSYHQKLRAVPSPDRSGLQGLTLVEHHKPVLQRVDERYVNATEADAVVDTLARLAPRADGWSFGVITFSSAQADEIRRRVERAVAAGRIAAGALARRSDEPFFVRAARDVQGQERDAVILSMGFAARDGVPIQRFGNLEGAFPLETVNVALTRARRMSEVHTSFDLADIWPAPHSRAAFVLASTLKTLRLCTRVPNRLEADSWLARYAKSRGLGLRHLGVVQGLFGEDDTRFRAGVVLREAMHTAERWGAIAAQLRARGWNIVEVGAACVGDLPEFERERLERALDLNCGEGERGRR